ncbi:MAG: cytochrome c [Campylobacterales bacterium]|nr:cytochrome c [Campylobacterales bacterium]NQY22091.1 cytochrome c [Campylobacteraceae bacterium]NQY53701.1 cytochrome c [Campylobacteraceae bacterium]
MRNKLKILLVFFIIVSNLYASEKYKKETLLGKQVYLVYCVQCHGILADGYGINVEDMSVLPKDHTNTKEMNALTNADLFKAIKFGGKAVNKSNLMPAWQSIISDKNIDAIVLYLRSVCCEKGEKK